MLCQLGWSTEDRLSALVHNCYHGLVYNCCHGNHTWPNEYIPTLWCGAVGVRGNKQTGIVGTINDLHQVGCGTCTHEQSDTLALPKTLVGVLHRVMLTQMYGCTE